MQTEAVALCMQQLADGNFGLCVLSFHRRHIAVALFRRMIIHLLRFAGGFDVADLQLKPHTPLPGFFVFVDVAVVVFLFGL